MRVIILAAGYATRLYPLTLDTPKCLLPVGGKTILDWIYEKLHWLSPIEEIMIVTNAKFFDKLNTWINGVHARTPIRLISDGTRSNETRLGAIADLELAVRQTSFDTDLLVLASDNLFEAGLEDFLSFARRKTEAVTIGLYDIKDRKLAAGRFGVVELDNSSEVKRIEEKPPKPRSSFVGMGVYYFPKHTLGFIGEYLGHPEANDAPGFYLRWLVGRVRIFGFLFSGMWYDIGDLNALKEADRVFVPKNQAKLNR